ncbi:hypothetical protein TeGR_g10746 [Tetraparma gracilis]|uniref:Uncharacterized protein n=1 Tax=Tetraparma gracilis TaxID=2962635 RepID=A0ABQ6MIW7_9STRA|nr:hypothetical protein TeGR_g10746 [Tetraparma gracilis]
MLSISLTSPSPSGPSTYSESLPPPPPLSAPPPNSTSPGQYTYSGLHDGGVLPPARADAGGLLAAAVVVRERVNAAITELVEREEAGRPKGTKRKGGA